MSGTSVNGIEKYVSTYTHAANIALLSCVTYHLISQYSFPKCEIALLTLENCACVSNSGCLVQLVYKYLHQHGGNDFCADEHCICVCNNWFGCDECAANKAILLNVQCQVINRDVLIPHYRHKYNAHLPKKSIPPCWCTYLYSNWIKHPEFETHAQFSNVSNAISHNVVHTKKSELTAEHHITSTTGAISRINVDWYVIKIHVQYKCISWLVPQNMSGCKSFMMRWYIQS